ncbi:MAG: hypothetical protein Q8T11_15160, partial [Elusimicrobiota bacterium]|nr:hypothetical protein [Elusimicrobiota bacterium]
MSLPGLLIAVQLSTGAAGAATMSGNVSGIQPVDIYQVTGNITVPSGLTLTLQPGTILKFNAGLSLTVNGTLISSGTVAEPVIFTSYADDAAVGDTNGDGAATTPGAGNWGVFSFDSANSASRVVRTIVRYGAYVNFNASSPVYQDSSVTDMSQAAFKMNGAAEPRGSGLTASNCPINGVDVLGGTISTVRVWSNLGIPYVLRTAQTTVGGSGSLTIEAGTVIKAQGTFHGNQGMLRADRPLTISGTAADPVIFTSLKDDTVGGDTNNDGGASAPARGDWQGVL